MKETNKIYYIDKEDELDACLNALLGCNEIGLDIEFDKERYTYGDTLCLIQICGGDDVFLIDALSDLNQERLYRFLEKPEVEKIMHAPGEDIQLLQQKGCYLKNIFDTARAARILNFSSFSLSALIHEFTGISLNKSQQNTNWTIRPLSAMQKKYAAEDVYYMPRIKSKLVEMASHRGVLDWIREENKSWDEFIADTKPQGIFTNKDDKKKFAPYYLFILNKLMEFRDHHAKMMNKPGYQVIPKELLIQLTMHPEKAETWMQMKGLYPGLKTASIQSEIQKIIEISEREATQSNLPKNFHRNHPGDKEGYIKKNIVEERVNTFLRPIKKQIEKDYGTETAGYILNEKTMREIASGQIKISELPFLYRKTLIKKIADNLQIHIEEFM